MNKKPKVPEYDAIIIQRGDCLKVETTYENEDTTPIDITGRTVEIAEASDPVIVELGEVTVIDAELGKVQIYLPIECTNQLLSGRSSWFRISLPSISDESPMMSPQIWVDMQ